MTENKNTKMVETSPRGHSAYNVVEEMKENKSRLGDKMDTRYTA